MDAIAEKAQVSKQTVYAHFKKKDELFDTCIRAKCIANQMDGNLVDDSRPIRDVLYDFAWQFQNMLLSEEVVKTYKTAVSQNDTHPDLARVYLNAGPKATTEMLVDYLQHNVNKGVLNIEIDLRDAAMQLLLMLHGKAVYWAYLGQETGETDEQRRQYLESCVDLFLKGYGK